MSPGGRWLARCCCWREGVQLVAIGVLVGVLGGIAGSVDDGLDMRMRISVAER